MSQINLLTFEEGVTVKIAKPGFSWLRMMILLCLYGITTPVLAQVTLSIDDGTQSTDGSYKVIVTTTYDCNGPGTQPDYCKYVIQESKNGGS